MSESIETECLLWINFGLYRQPCHRSAHTPEADENYAKADLPVGMSAVGGRADVACQELSGPFIAKSGSYVTCSYGWIEIVQDQLELKVRLMLERTPALFRLNDIR